MLRLVSLIIYCIRGGQGGGYKELDEEELEEVKKRWKEADEVGCLCLLNFFFCIFCNHCFPFLNVACMVG